MWLAGFYNNIITKNIHSRLLQLNREPIYSEWENPSTLRTILHWENQSTVRGQSTVWGQSTVIEPIYSAAYFWKIGNQDFHNTWMSESNADKKVPKFNSFWTFIIINFIIKIFLANFLCDKKIYNFCIAHFIPINLNVKKSEICLGEFITSLYRLLPLLADLVIAEWVAISQNKK